jgi:hypothetical protein
VVKRFRVMSIVPIVSFASSKLVYEGRPVGDAGTHPLPRLPRSYEIGLKADWNKQALDQKISFQGVAFRRFTRPASPMAMEGVSP